MKCNCLGRIIRSGLVLLVGLSLVPSVFSHEIELELLTGVDSNPNRLSETFEVDQVPFAQLGLKISHMPTRTGFYYDFDLNGEGYISDEDAVSDPKHADNSRGEATLGFKWRPRLKYGRARFKWDVYAGAKDSTYVRKSTGNIALSPEDPITGVEIPDRFDSSWSGFSSSGVVPISDEADFIFDVYVEDKQYEELIGLSLSNLNYQQGEVDIGFEKRIWPKVNLKTMIGGGYRTYEDRRAKQEITGDDIPGSDLKFNFLEVENTLEYLITERWKWQLGFDVDQRQDNEDGYYDTTQGQLFTRFQYRNKKSVRFVLYASYVKKKFDNIELNPAANIVEEDLREREGFRARAELTRAIFEYTRLNMDLVIGVEATSFKNSNPIFTYDRNLAYFGVRWHPY